MIRFHPAALALLALTACTADEPKKLDASPQAIADAGPPPAPDAGPPPAPDVGPAPDAGMAAAASTGTADAPRAKSSAFDRILAKPKDASLSLDDIKAKAERATGAKVQSIKKSMRTWVLIELAPASPPRDDAEQRKIIGKLEGTGLFSAIEGDRIMKVK